MNVHVRSVNLQIDPRTRAEIERRMTAAIAVVRSAERSRDMRRKPAVNPAFVARDT